MAIVVDLSIFSRSNNKAIIDPCLPTNISKTCSEALSLLRSVSRKIEKEAGNYVCRSLALIVALLFVYF